MLAVFGHIGQTEILQLLSEGGAAVTPIEL